MPVLTRLMLVTSRSSPTHCMFGIANVISLNASQSSSSNGSSILMTGNFSVKLRYIDVSSSTVTELDGSACGFLKSRSYLPLRTTCATDQNATETMNSTSSKCCLQQFHSTARDLELSPFDPKIWSVHPPKCVNAVSFVKIRHFLENYARKHGRTDGRTNRQLKHA